MARNGPPWITSGAPWFSPSAEIFAPIFSSGVMMRLIGRPDSDASPTSRERNGCPASSPANRRIVVPELPQSIALGGALSCR